MPYTNNNNIMEQTTTTKKEPVKRDKLTVRGAAMQAFSEMPDTFYSLDFCIAARKHIRNNTMDGTFLRRLQELRNDGLCVYKVLNSGAGQYQKVVKD